MTGHKNNAVVKHSLWKNDIVNTKSRQIASEQKKFLKCEMSYSDEAVEHFGQFMRSLDGEQSPRNSLSLENNRCAICLDLLFNPHQLDPCQHIFCEPCLRRLSGARITKCPMCRTRIQQCIFQRPLADSLRLNNPTDFQRRHDFEIGQQQNFLQHPLPPIWRSPREVLEELLDQYVIPEEGLLILIFISTIFMQICLITLMHAILHNSQRLPLSVFRLVIEIAVCILRMFRIWPFPANPDGE